MRIRTPGTSSTANSRKPSRRRSAEPSRSAGAKDCVVVTTSRPPAASIVELAARTLQPPGKPWVDLGHDSSPLSLDALAQAGGGVFYCAELGRLTRLQQKNLSFALDRLDRHNLRLVAATTHDAAALVAQGWDEAGLKAKVDSGEITILADQFTPAWATETAQDNMEAIIDKAVADGTKIDAAAIGCAKPVASTITCGSSRTKLPRGRLSCGLRASGRWFCAVAAMATRFSPEASPSVEIAASTFSK